MPPFVFSEFLATMPTLPLALAFVTVAGVVTWRVLSRRERDYRAQVQRDRLRMAALERARFEAITRIRANHDKGAA